MEMRALSLVLGITALVVFNGCGSESDSNEPSDSQMQSSCTTHEMRPDRLFDIVDHVSALSKDEADPSSKTIFVIPGHWSPFWSTPKTGFTAAKDELGFSGEFRAACNAEDSTCIEDQAALFTELTDGDDSNDEADGIAIGVKGADMMEPLISEATSKIPIITFDADVSNAMDTGRHLYLGAMNIPAGESAGQTMLDLLEHGGEFHVIAKNLAAANLMERAAGAFAACLGTSFASASEFAASSYCSDLETTHMCQADCKGDYASVTAFAVAYEPLFNGDSTFQDDNPEANAEDYLRHWLEQKLSNDSPPAGLISLHGTPSPILEKAIADNARAGEIKLVAWDFSSEVQAGLKSGTVNAAMVQNSYFYGYLSAHIAYAMVALDTDTVNATLAPYFEEGTEDHLLDTGMIVVTGDNLANYSEYQEQCLGLTSG